MCYLRILKLNDTFALIITTTNVMKDSSNHIISKNTKYETIHFNNR